MSEAHEDVRRRGRDELNLAEHPLALLTDRMHEGGHALVFQNPHGSVTIAGSTTYGLPTSQDADVLLALLTLTKARNDFTESYLDFSRYELLKLMRWPEDGPHYRRLNESLNRWVGVTFYYDGCWWNQERKRRVNASFHILDYVMIPNDVQSLSCLSWNVIFFQSCQAGNLKQLDLTTYFRLKSAISKQIYRFLDKRFYHRPAWTFDLCEFAYEHIGLSRNYADNGKIKEKLAPAIEELVGIGFLAPMTKDERYEKRGPGQWNVHFKRQLSPPPETQPSLPEPEPMGLENELITRGITSIVAAQLIHDFPAELIQAKLQQVDWLRAKQPKKVRDQAAYLTQSIRQNFAPPAGFQEHKAKEPEPDDETRARQRDERAEIEKYWQSLTPEQRLTLDDKAAEQADPVIRADLHHSLPERRLQARSRCRVALIRDRLGLPRAPETEAKSDTQEPA